MRYTYVAYRTPSDRWEAFCPAWPGIRAAGETQADCLGHLSDKLTAQCADLFCRALPLPADFAVEVGTLPAMETDGAPWTE